MSTTIGGHAMIRRVVGATIDGSAIPPHGWPRLLAETHGELAVGATVEVRLGDSEAPLPIDHLLHGGGFERVRMAPDGTVVARRARTLPDFVGPGMRVLCCGLNPSVYAADAGVGFARPGNRFWPAAQAAGLTCDRRDGLHALDAHGVGMTDLVKRATPAADVLTAAEYVRGLERVGALCGWLEPAVVCFVGLAGWRAAATGSAAAGWQARRVGDRPTYVMPSTSGRNASSTFADLVDHLTEVARAAGDPPPPPAR